MSMILDGTNGATFNDGSLQAAAASPYVLKNRIINGDMVIDQRNAGASSSAGGYTVDRWATYGSQASKFSVQQNAGAVTPPAGFTNYVGITVGASANVTIAAADVFQIYQPIEGFNVADLAYGTASAAPVTLSFWVRSSLTGTFSGSLYSNGSFPFSYVINSANTWEYKTVSILANTAYALTSTTNGIGIILSFDLGAGSTYIATSGSWGAGVKTKATGSVNLVSTNSATLYITGVQLEIGSTATPFERRLYGQEMANCQRYYWKVDGGTTSDYVGIGSGFCQSATSVRIYAKYPVAMRAAPTIAIAGTLYADDGAAHTISSISTAFEGLDQMMIDFNTSSKNTGRGVVCYVLNSSGNNLTANAEL